MTRMDNLPPLPEPGALNSAYRVYTANEMRAYAEEAVKQEREAIAAMFDDSPHAEMFRSDIAAAIRARSEQGA